MTRACNLSPSAEQGAATPELDRARFPPLGQRSLPITRYPEGVGPRAPSEVWVGGVLTSRRWFEGDVELEESFSGGKLRSRLRRELAPAPGLRSREVNETFPVGGYPRRRVTTTVDATGLRTVLDEVDPSGRGEWRRVPEPAPGARGCPGIELDEDVFR